VAKKVTNRLEEDPAAFEAHLEQLERKFDRLKNLYESFFSGIERQPPTTGRTEMNRLMLAAQQLKVGKAALRFRFQTLNQRWITYVALWNRTMREIENGTYRRDLVKARRLLERHGDGFTEEQAIAMGIPAFRARAFVARQAGRGTSGARARQVPPPPSHGISPVPGLTAAELDQFYASYSDAHASSATARPKKSLDELCTRLKPQMEKLLAKHGARRARLEVAVTDGAVRIRARPVSEDT